MDDKAFLDYYIWLVSTRGEVTAPSSKDNREPQDTAGVHESCGMDCYIFPRGGALYSPQ